jgi:hypothetical protein
MKGFWSVRVAGALHELMRREMELREMLVRWRVPAKVVSHEELLLPDREAARIALGGIEQVWKGWRGVRFWWWRYSDEEKARRITRMTAAQVALRQASRYATSVAMMGRLGEIARSIDTIAWTMMERGR